MPKFEAKGRDFSMRPIDPTTAEDNFCSRCLNMVLGSDGALHRRPGFASAASAGGLVQNHIVAEVNGTPYLFIKVGTEIKYTSGLSFQTISGFTSDAQDPVPPWPVTADALARGSFAFHGGEVYYTDKGTHWAWGDNPSVTTVRQTGVRSLKGKVYNGTGSADLGTPSQPPTDAYFDASPPAICPADEVLRPNPTIPYDGTCGTDPYIDINKGEKSRMTSIAFSFYDPKRRTYGKRSETFCMPYIFGAQGVTSSDSTGTSSQSYFWDGVLYAKLCQTPPAPTGHQVAIWCSLGYEPVNTGLNPLLTSTTTPAFLIGTVSKRGIRALFLEGHFPPNRPLNNPVRLEKDDATLVQSGAYIDVFARPVPAKFMCILPNGIALYFYPLKDETTPAAGLANYIEYSVRHPEQIGRNTDNQRESVSTLANLRGEPKALITEGNTQLLLTRQGIYFVGFDGGAVFSEAAGGRGLRSERSIAASSSVGVLWGSDAGVVWLQGGSTILLDHRLGFDAWFSEIDDAEKLKIAVGVSDVTNEIMAFTVDPASGRRAMVYDHVNKFACEFILAGSAETVEYLASFPAVDATRLWAFTTSGSGFKYPQGTSDGGSNPESEVRYWVVTEKERTKSLGMIVLDIGKNTAAINVTVNCFDHSESTAPFALARSESASIPIGSTGRRVPLHQFMSLQGRIFEIVVESDSSTEWSIESLDGEYEFQDADHLGQP